MKTLFLIRHAKSSWSDGSLDDFNRPLNNRGKISADFMGKELAKKGIKPDKIIASPAKRTQRTSERIAQKIGYPNINIAYYSELYLGDIQSLLEIVNSLSDDNDTVFLVGHNPGITMFFNYVCGEFAEMVTCAVAEITFDIDSWAAVSNKTGTLQNFTYPKKYDEFNQLLNG